MTRKVQGTGMITMPVAELKAQFSRVLARATGR